ncbi:MAG: DNA polymerase Y family protein [Gammaproteobacteria bacterium]
MSLVQRKRWNRAIVFIDMDAFFASIEQNVRPELRGKPIGITNGLTGTCFITCSYEARAYGIKTGTRLKQAQYLCPHVQQIPARPELYAKVSTDIMSALQSVTPDIEVFSVDEAFLDITHCQGIYKNPIHAGELARQIVEKVAGVTCSVGISGDKTTAKHAAKLIKPDGLIVVPPWLARAHLKDVPVTELSGIAAGIGEFLNDRKVYVCGDMAKMPISELAKRFGNLGRRIWYMAQGLDPEPLNKTLAAPKSIGHGKIMPPNTKSLRVLKTYLHHMSEKVATRLRKHSLEARSFFIGFRVKHANHKWLASKFQSEEPTNDGRKIWLLAKQLLDRWSGEGVFQVQITALDLRPSGNQLSFFSVLDEQRQCLNRAIDQINERFGEFAIAPATLLQRSDMPNVIAPSWKPEGHRRTV